MLGADRCEEENAGVDDLVRCAVAFEPDTGRMVFWGAELPTGIGELGTLRDTSEPALRLPVKQALPVLSRARRHRDAHTDAAFWGQATVVALQLVAKGSIDEQRLDDLAATMPSVPEVDRLPLVKGFLDAVADGMGAVVRRPSSQVWADGATVSLRIEFDGTDCRAVVQLHSRRDPALVCDRADLDNGLGTVRARSDAGVWLSRAAREWPPLIRALEVDSFVLGDHEIAQLLDGAGERLAARNVPVHWPKELVRDVQVRLALRDDRPADLRSDQPLALDWQLALGDDPLTADEIEQLVRAHRPIVRLREQWLLIDSSVARKARSPERELLSPLAALGIALTGSTDVDGRRVDVVAGGRLGELRDRIADAEGGAELLVRPAALDARLRDYQLRGLRWLVRMTSLGLGCCLADDMGLGKTITVIALHLHRCQGPTLVVCPASLLGNWEREIHRFAPGVPVRRFHGTQRSLDDLTDGFVLTTYGTMRVDAERLGTVPWDLVVADEAQHVKNARSGAAKALRAIARGVRVALTGTPVENSLGELWAILDWAAPGLLGTRTSFRAKWSKPIEADRDGERAALLARLLKPFLLRRLKTDPGIAPELPAKTETDQFVPLTREQAGLYEAVVREAMADIAGSTGMARRGKIVTLLTSLKQICNHPAQYLKQDTERLTGRSGKLELLDELLDTIVAEDHAVLVFTQYVAMARLIERHLTDRDLPCQFLHGGTPVAHREEMVQSFQDGAVPIFLISLKAGGTGLNLTRADHVVHYDRWWNPAVEDQATDRAHRIGQTRPVQVHRLMTEGTVEDRIAALLTSKRALADAVLTGGEAALTELSDAELAELVQL